MTHTFDITYDYIVVGAGSAGCVLANRLSADPTIRVLLIEAGGNDSDPLIHMPVGFIKASLKPTLNWGYQSEPEPGLLGRRVPIPRGKVLGGSSSINGMFFIRGHRRDFDEWAELGCQGWGYADVLPYFRRLETHWRGDGAFHGGNGPIQVNPIDTTHLLAEPLTAAAQAAGYRVVADYDGEADPEGVARGDVSIDQRGRRSSSARAYLHPVLQRPNLTVHKRALAHQVLLEGKRAVGLRYAHAGQVVNAGCRREVILAGGAYGSPQLLMLSGIGPADGLQAHGIPVQHHLPGVGGNLIEHPRMMLQFEATRPVTFLRQLRLDRAVASALRWAVQGKGAFATQISSATVLLRTRADLDRPDIQLLCNPIRLDANLWLPGLRPAGQHSFYITVCQLHARSRGQVSLRSNRPDDSPRIQLNIFTHPDDFISMREGVRAARRIYRSLPQGELTGRETIPGDNVLSDDALDAAIRQYGGITHHPVGTCRMGADPLAVVDPQLRVHGIDRLRVADASIMPTITSGNTNAASLMIGEKAAALILGQTLPAATLPPEFSSLPTAESL